MILELVAIRTVGERSDEFPAVLEQARPLIAATEGFLGLEVRRCLEEPDRYVLLISWRALADHTEGFRSSARYQRWRELLTPLYAEAPNVLHYQPVGRD